MAGGRVGDLERAERINAAAVLAESGVATADAGRAGGTGGRRLRRGGRGAVGVPSTGPWTASTPVNDRLVETEFVFDRHAATDLSVAYAILVPQRRVRIARSGQEASLCHDECGDLRPSVLGPAE